MIDNLIATLATASVADDVYNQYADDGSLGNAVRRENLKLYFEQVLGLGAQLILVGEAPGYLGCRRTGVPFTSEQLLLAGIDPPGLFGSQYGFRSASDDGRVPAEQTATIVWRELRKHEAVALGWNAWPFHPHRSAVPLSNRTPRVSELRQGLPFLKVLLGLAPGLPVVAMGNSAARSLSWLGVDHHKVRHPAQGGARSFAAGLSAVLAQV